jgi:hypothetical protein
MKTSLYLTFCAALAAPMVAGAANFDGETSVVCATLEAVQCAKLDGARHVCARGPAQGLNVPQFVKLDFAKKLVSATKESGVEKTSPIGSVSRGNEHIVVQGFDAGTGRGWSLVVEENTGQMTASAIGDEEGMMIFGACTQI